MKLRNKTSSQISSINSNVTLNLTDVFERCDIPQHNPLTSFAQRSKGPSVTKSGVLMSPWTPWHFVTGCIDSGRENARFLLASEYKELQLLTASSAILKDPLKSEWLIQGRAFMHSAQTAHMAEVPFKRHTTGLPVTEQVLSVSSDACVGLRSSSSWGKVKSHNKIAGYARL